MNLRQMMNLIGAYDPSVIRAATDAEVAKYATGGQEFDADRVTISVMIDGQLLEECSLSAAEYLYLQKQAGIVRARQITRPSIWGIGPASGPDGYLVSFGNAFMGLNSVVGAWAAPDPEPPAPPPSALWDNPQAVTEEIIAYRSWHCFVMIDDESRLDALLKSVSMDTKWFGPVALADELPTAVNGNGIHAIGDEPRHKGNFESYVKAFPVWGRVALSGTVVEGENGFRAERAVIQELFVNLRLWERVLPDISAAAIIPLLEARYQCDASIRRPRWQEIRKQEQKLLTKGEGDAALTE